MSHLFAEARCLLGHRSTKISTAILASLIASFLSCSSADADPYNWSTQLQIIGSVTASVKYPNIKGTGITIAVIDSGLDFTQPWFAAGGRSVTGWDFSGGQTWPSQLWGGNSDTEGHGSGVAAFAAGNGNGFYGVASNANLMVLRINGYDGQTIANALSWLKNDPSHHGVSVVNLSRGAGTWQGYQDAQALMNQGVFVSVAAGNITPQYNPGALFDKGLFYVGGSDLSGSSFGTDQYGDSSVGGPGVSLAAPISGLWVGYPGAVSPQFTTAGTSWAAPQAAGAAALLKQVNPSFTAQDIANILISSATSTTNDWRFGLNYPFLNVTAALDLACARFSNPAICGGSTPTPVATGNYFSCALANPNSGSWIRQSYLAGGAGTYNTLGCPITAEIVPPGIPGVSVYQAFEKGGLCMAWNKANPNNWVPTNFTIQPCSSVAGYQSVGGSPTPVPVVPSGPSRIQDCPRFAAMNPASSWIAMSFFADSTGNFAKLGCPAGDEISASDGRYAYQVYDKGCMAWNWNQPYNYVATNYVAKATGHPCTAWEAINVNP